MTYTLESAALKLLRTRGPRSCIPWQAPVGDGLFERTGDDTREIVVETGAAVLAETVENTRRLLAHVASHLGNRPSIGKYIKAFLKVILHPDTSELG